MPCVASKVSHTERLINHNELCNTHMYCNNCQQKMQNSSVGENLKSITTFNKAVLNYTCKM